jgi:hypothetical protein
VFVSLSFSLCGVVIITLESSMFVGLNLFCRLFIIPSHQEIMAGFGPFYFENERLG